MFCSHGSCVLLPGPVSGRGEGDRAEPEISGEDPEVEKPDRETGVQEELSARLAGFAGIIYEYDTLERKFYVGAQDYMTEDAFGSFAPLAGEGGDDGSEDVKGTVLSAGNKSYYCFWTNPMRRRLWKAVSPCPPVEMEA